MKRSFIFFVALLLCFAASADNSHYVNLFMGTAGDHGQVTPAAQIPFGLASACPDAVKPRHGGYDYEQSEIKGISVTRISGVGGDGTGGNLSIRPAYKDQHLKIKKGSEVARPGFYGAVLDNGVEVELTVTHNVAAESYDFSAAEDKVLTLDVNSAIDSRRSECGWQITGDSDIHGWVKTSTTCNQGVYKLFFHIRTSEPFKVTSQEGDVVTMQFADDVRRVEVRIALSPIDEEVAARELEIIGSKSFRQIKSDAADAWKEVLSRIDVYGSTKEQKVLFYTGMYRVFLSPMDATSYDGSFRGKDGQIHKADGWRYYSSWSMWDTYRTKFPLLAILAPDETRDFCRSLVTLYRTGKKNWATMDECVPTVRTEHSQLMLLDAWSKGIRGFDLSEAFPGMEKEYREGLVAGSRQGLTRNAPDQKMETVYDIWGMSRIAGIIGDNASRDRYRDEAERLFEETWKTEFMTITDQFSQMKGNGMYQGTRWQYRWAMPPFAGKMIKWTNSERLADELNDFFAHHLFNQGNEPDIQTPFMFNLFGHPERTDSLVHALLTDDNMIHIYGGNAEFPEPFVGRAFRDRYDGYAPEMDEDDGAMSAWYLFCQLGFYPLCVGTDSYELFTPLFPKVKMHLPAGELTIRRKCKETTATRILVDGQPLEGRSISHQRLFGSCEIVFE